MELQDSAQRARCHRVLRFPDGRRVRHVLRRIEARCRSREAWTGRATAIRRHKGAESDFRAFVMPDQALRAARIYTPEMIAEHRPDQRIGLLLQVQHHALGVRHERRQPRVDRRRDQARRRARWPARRSLGVPVRPSAPARRPRRPARRARRTPPHRRTAPAGPCPGCSAR